MNSLEKAARALFDEVRNPEWGWHDDHNHAQVRAAVRAVLLAVREPTDEMATAFEPFGCSKGLWSDPDEYREWYGDRVDFGTSWAAAIDAILSPTDGGER